MRLQRYWLAGMFVLFLGLAQNAAAQEAALVVTDVQGGAFIVRNGVRVMAEKGMACQEGDVVETLEDGRVDVSMNGLAGFRLLGSTQGKISNAAPENMKVTVNEGNVLVNARKLGDSDAFTLETPTAVAAVRGTQFWGRVVSPEGVPVTTIAVREGTVEITPTGLEESILVEVGEALDLAKDLTQAPVKRKAETAEMFAMEQAAEIAIWTSA